MHDKACLADALIAAVQNLRDSDTIKSDEEFRRAVQNGTVLDWADSYLSDGTKTCICAKASEIKLPSRTEIAEMTTADLLAKREEIMHSEDDNLSDTAFIVLNDIDDELSKRQLNPRVVQKYVKEYRRFDGKSV
jgi:hypothetical protein